MSKANAAAPTACRWCGEDHHGKRCPEVKAIEWAMGPTGVPFISRVEYLTPVDHPPTRVRVGDEEIEGEYPTLKPLGRA